MLRYAQDFVRLELLGVFTYERTSLPIAMLVKFYYTISNCIEFNELLVDI